MVSRRLGNLETNKIVAKATFLDPRFKKAGFGHDDNTKNAQQWVTDELSHLISQDRAQRAVTETNRNNNPARVSTNRTTGSTLGAHFDEKVAQSHEIQSTTTSAIIMVKQYLESSLINRNEDPLNYWREHAKIFPRLYTLAKKYLAIPATSVPSERLFSKAGYVLGDRRNRMDSQKLDQIMFLNGNI